MDAQDDISSRELTTVEAVLNSPGNCQVTTKVQAPAPFSTTIATGTMFSVTAKQNIEILSFEFAHFPFDSDLEVEIYMITGKDYVAQRSTPSAWTKISSTTSVDSPDTADADINIAPRADMTQAVTLQASQSVSFYFTLKSQHLKLEPSSQGKPLTTGTEYFSDNFISTDVGIGVRLGGFPNTPDDTDRGFQGRIHYRVIQSCSELLGQTQATVKAAVPSSEVPASPNAEFLNAFTGLLDARVDWARWKSTEGLKLNSVSATVAETKTDCSDLGLSGACTVYDNKLTMVHYASLAGKEVELEVIRSVVESNNTVAFGGGTMTYVGPKVLSRFYRLQLVGIPSGTILNPIQRAYISTVTLDFLTAFSEKVPNSVEVISQDFGRRELLRGGDDDGGDRQLQSGLVTAESYIYGIGDDAQAFYEPIETAFRDNEAAYRASLVGEQYRPGAINDGENFGTTFKDLLRISVKTNETVVDTTTTAAVDKTDTTGVIVWSILLALSLLFLIYRVVKDFMMQKDGHRIKKEKVSERKEKLRQEGGGEEAGGKPPPSSYIHGGRNAGNPNSPNVGRKNGPGKKKKKGPPPGGRQPMNAGSGHSAGQRPPPKKRPPGSKSPTRRPNNGGPNKRPAGKKKRPPKTNEGVV